MLKILIFALFGMLHPVHVSMVSMEHNNKDNRLDVSVKMSTVDLAIDMGMFHLFNHHLELTEDVTFTVEDAKPYLDRVLNVTVKGKQLPVFVTGIENDNNDAIITGYYQLPGKHKEFTVVNTILLEYYDIQDNLFIFKEGETEIPVRFTPDERMRTFKLN